MRRVLLMLLVVLLLFNGLAGVSSLRCLHEFAGGEAVQGRHAGHADHHLLQANSVAHADPASQDGEMASAADGVDCAHADCGGCCHASGLFAVGFARLLAVGAAVGEVLATFADASPDSPALDGPFRPPRTASS